MYKIHTDYKDETFSNNRVLNSDIEVSRFFSIFVIFNTVFHTTIEI